MAITQMALIQSLGQALAWFEREISWGVPATELRHLCGRIGELFVAVYTNGQMANEVNQKGYDVISWNNERISVKTTATLGSDGFVIFNTKTLKYVDCIIILQINADEQEVNILFDKSINEALKFMGPEKNGKRSIPLNKLIAKPTKNRITKTVLEVSHDIYILRELGNGSIEIEKEGKPQLPVKPILRTLATELNIGLLNNNGNKYNTRQLGGLVMRRVQELKEINLNHY